MTNPHSARELTVRAFLLSTLLTVLFTMANAYLGLKAGFTFATSIPAAVISMAVLKLFKIPSILENNIVQTISSAAGAVAAIVFILPALPMLHIWHEFPFWQTTLLCGTGGTLGVMFTIPLRRALVVNSDLPYPEGTAAAKVLQLGADTTEATDTTAPPSTTAQPTEKPIKDILVGTTCAFLYSLLSSGLNLFSSHLSYYGRLGPIVTGTGLNCSFALIGAGYLIGIRIGLAILLGAIISWGIAVPWLSLKSHYIPLHAAQVALHIWSTQVRFLGAGTMGVAAIWSVIRLLKPLYQGIRSSINTLHKKSYKKYNGIPLSERDIPITWVIIISGGLSLPLIALFGSFLFGIYPDSPPEFIAILVLVSVFLAMFLGFMVAAVSGEMAGLVGSSNTPISGVGILAVIIISLAFAYLGIATTGVTPIEQTQAVHHLTALAIFTTAAVFAMACVSNDNLQDLKTGHLIGATPWKQQVALVFGIIVGSIVIAPVLNQLYHAYGFADALPRAGMNPKLALAAPQATIMAALAQGIISKHAHWNMMLTGAAIGGFLILIDELLLKRIGHFRLSVLSVGFGIYLPPEMNMALLLGSLISYFVHRKLPQAGPTREQATRRGTLLVSGLIVGDSLFGILLATMITTTGSQDPIAIVNGRFQPLTYTLGAILFFAVCYFIYRYVLNRRYAQLSNQ